MSINSPKEDDIKNSWLSRDQEAVKIFLSDKKSNFQFTLNGL